MSKGCDRAGGAQRGNRTPDLRITSRSSLVLSSADTYREQGFRPSVSSGSVPLSAQFRGVGRTKWRTTLRWTRCTTSSSFLSGQRSGWGEARRTRLLRRTRLCSSDSDDLPRCPPRSPRPTRQATTADSRHLPPQRRRMRPLEQSRISFTARSRRCSRSQTADATWKAHVRFGPGHVRGHLAGGPIAGSARCRWLSEASDLGGPRRSGACHGTMDAGRLLAGSLDLGEARSAPGRTCRSGRWARAVESVDRSRSRSPPHSPSAITRPRHAGAVGSSAISGLGWMDGPTHARSEHGSRMCRRSGTSSLTSPPGPYRPLRAQWRRQDPRA